MEGSGATDMSSATGGTQEQVSEGKRETMMSGTRANSCL